MSVYIIVYLLSYAGREDVKNRMYIEISVESIGFDVAKVIDDSPDDINPCIPEGGNLVTPLTVVLINKLIYGI